MPSPLDQVTKQPNIKDIPEKPGKTWGSIFLYVLILYAAWCTYTMQVDKKECISPEMYNKSQSDLKDAYEFIQTMAANVQQQKEITKQAVEEVTQKKDSIDNVVNPAIETYNSSYHKIKRNAK